MQSVEAEFLSKIKNLEPYWGKWIAILDSGIIVMGYNINKVYKDAIKKSKRKMLLFYRVPAKGEAKYSIL